MFLALSYCARNIFVYTKRSQVLANNIEKRSIVLVNVSLKKSINHRPQNVVNCCVQYYLFIVVLPNCYQK